MTEVKIIDEKYEYFTGEVQHQYQAYCTRCLKTVRGSSGNAIWATKPPAVKAAKEHLEDHPGIESYLDRIVNRGARIVGTVTE